MPDSGLGYWNRMLMTVASKECHVPGPHLCHEATPLSLYPCEHVAVDPDSFFTWRPRNSIFLSLCRDKSLGTVVHLYDTAQSFFASMSCLLPATVPDKSVILGQYVEDEDPQTSSLHPRVLLFDVLVLGGQVMNGMPVRKRYELLRNIVPSNGATGALGPLSVQWVGEYQCSAVITQRRMALPHPVESLLVLRDQQVCALDCVRLEEWWKKK